MAISLFFIFMLGADQWVIDFGAKAHPVAETQHDVISCDLLHKTGTENFTDRDARTFFPNQSTQR